MINEEQKEKKKIARRKFFIFSALASAAAGFLRKFAKNPKIAFKDLGVSLHPAQFYKKLHSDQ